MARTLRTTALAAALLSLVATARSETTAAPCAPLPGAGAAFAANDNHVGVIDLYYFGSQGAPVTYYECVDQQPVRLGERSAMRDGYTPMYGAAPWTCSRRTRLFAAVVALPDGTTQRGLTDIRTPSCATRFRVHAPARAALGHRVVVRVRDRWGIGDIATRWCVTPPGHRPRCEGLRFVTAQRTAQRTFAPDRLGRWRAAVIAGRFQAAASVAVGVRGAPARHLPRVLATGDSTMQGVDVALADELSGTADVISDVHPGSGLSQDNRWITVARRQAVARHATTIVLSIGADEGWPMTGADGVEHTCCDMGWTDEYVRRMRRVLNIYRRHAHVIVLTVVAPRDPDRAAIVAATNGATVRAAEGVVGVRLMRIDQLFTPNGYQETIRYRGRDVAVREPDGVHLNIVGTTIEARLAEPLVRASLRAGRARQQVSPSSA